MSHSLLRRRSMRCKPCRTMGSSSTKRTRVFVATLIGMGKAESAFASAYQYVGGRRRVPKSEESYFLCRKGPTLRTRDNPQAPNACADHQMMAKILVIDDEPACLAMTSQALRKAGYS